MPRDSKSWPHIHLICRVRYPVRTIPYTKLIYPVAGSSHMKHAILVRHINQFHCSVMFPKTDLPGLIFSISLTLSRLYFKIKAMAGVHNIRIDPFPMDRTRIF